MYLNDACVLNAQWPQRQQLLDALYIKILRVKHTLQGCRLNIIVIRLLVKTIDRSQLVKLQSNGQAHLAKIFLHDEEVHIQVNWIIVMPSAANTENSRC